MFLANEKFHERKEIAGRVVVFGAEPEPALTEEVEWLRWRFRSLATNEPFTDIEEASARSSSGMGRNTARSSSVASATSLE